jgi:hypothetical protein
MSLKILSHSFKSCLVVHLSVFSAAFVSYMPSGSVAAVIDQLTESFEFLFSVVPLDNSYILSSPTAESIAMQLIIIFLVTALPSYIVGYPLFVRYFNRQLYE